MNISFFGGNQRLTSRQFCVFFVYSLYSLSSYLSQRSVLTLLFICKFKLNAFRPADYKLLKISTDNKCFFTTRTQFRQKTRTWAWLGMDQPVTS